jgi:hypothetical protein
MLASPATDDRDRGQRAASDRHTGAGEGRAEVPSDTGANSAAGRAGFAQLQWFNWCGARPTSGSAQVALELRLGGGLLTATHLVDPVVPRCDFSQCAIAALDLGLRRAAELNPPRIFRPMLSLPSRRSGRQLGTLIVIGALAAATRLCKLTDEPRSGCRAPPTRLASLTPSDGRLDEC